MSTADVHTLSGAYAVDALDDLERERFEQHLAGCPACRTEAAELGDAAAALSALVASPPSPDLRPRVLAASRRVRPLPPPVRPARVSRPPRTSGRSPALPPARRRARSWRAAATAAAVLAVVGAGALVADQVERPRAEPAATASVADRVLAAADAETVRVDLPGGASARLVRSVRERTAVLVTSDMPAAPDGTVYELWLQHDDAMVPAGLMPGSGDALVVLEGDAADADGAGITVEPEGGSAEPTGVPVVLFEFDEAT